MKVLALCVVVLICDIANVLGLQEPILPPRQRIEQQKVLSPLTARKAPKHSESDPPIITIDPSPSTEPQSRPVDPSQLTIGNCVEHRTYVDYPERLQIVFPDLKFPGDGNITAWKVYGARDCELFAQVFRPAPIPRALDDNKFPVSNFILVGNNTLSIPALGEYTFEIEKESRIKVRFGDVIGFYSESPGCISWSDGGPRTLYRYGFPGRNEMKALEGIVFIGEGVSRTYSIECSGEFTVSPHELLVRESPSSSFSTSPSVLPSRSPTRSLSNSISVTPISSPSASPSSDASATPSFSSSASASPIDMDSSSPTPTVSLSPSVTASVSATPPPRISVNLHKYPTPTPSASLHVAPYAMDSSQEAEGTGATACHYCNGGTDWTGGMCLSGQQQSPVQLSFEQVKTQDEMNLYLSTNYNISRARVSWNDYAFAITSTVGSFGSINIDGVNYDAEMATIHAPSEHKIEGIRTPMEIQIFHKKRDSNPPETLAVAVLFEETAAEVHSMDWIYAIPTNKEAFQVVVNFEDYFSDMKPLIFYNGSLTQPPCTEGIQWAVSMSSAKVSYSQMKRVNKFLKEDVYFANGRGNNRVTQPLNGRTMLLRSNCGMSGSIACARAQASAKAIPVEEGGPAIGDDGLFDDEGIKLW